METIYKIDIALVVVSIVVLIGVVGYATPLVIAPLDGYKTSDSEILFSIDNANVLFVDDNIDFTTPEEYSLEDGLKINLKPGTYYWKAVGVLESKVRTLTINSEVNLKLEFNNGSYNVVNAGNIRLNIDVYNGTELVDRVKLDVAQSTDVLGTKFIGGIDE
jgi:hypothetical protein